MIDRKLWLLCGGFGLTAMAIAATAIQAGSARTSSRQALYATIPAPTAPAAIQQRNFGASGLWSRAGDGTDLLRGVHASRAMDLIHIRTPRTAPLVVQDVEADKVRQFLDIYDNKTKPSVANLTVRRIRAGFLKRGIRLRYGSNAIVIRDFRLTHLGPSRSRGDIPVGIGLYDDVHNVLIERGVIENVLSELPSEKHYWNADGISLERGVHDVVLRDIVIRNCTDGGIDSKATNLLIDRVSITGCARNLRLWEDAAITSLESIDPVKRGGVGGAAHIGLYKGLENVKIDRLIIRSAKPIPIFMMEADAPATVVVGSHDIVTPRGTPIVGGKFPDRLKLIWKSGPPKL
jgi:hypothetical protein